MLLKGLKVKRLKAFFLTGALLFASSCATSPELVEAARPNPKTPSQITGVKYGACIADKKFAKSDNIIPIGIFSQAETYDFAHSMFNMSKKYFEYALRIRAYQIPYTSKTFLFGTTVVRKLVCYYELQDGKLRYLTHLAPDDRNRVDAGVYNQAVLKAYAIMAGKDVRNVQFFGIFAD